MLFLQQIKQPIREYKDNNKCKDKDKYKDSKGIELFWTAKKIIKL